MQDTRLSTIITQKGGMRSRGVESGMQSVGSSASSAMVNFQGVSNSEADRRTEGSQHLEWYQRPPFVEANFVWQMVPASHQRGRPPAPETYGQIGPLGSPRNRSSMSKGGMNADNRRNSDQGDDDGRQEGTEIGKCQVEDPLMDDVKELHRLVSQRGSAAAESGSSNPSKLPPPSPFPQAAEMERGCGAFPVSEERKVDDENRKSEPWAQENVDVKSPDAGQGTCASSAHVVAPQLAGVNSSVVLSTLPTFPQVLVLAIFNLFNICLCGVECVCVQVCACVGIVCIVCGRAGGVCVWIRVFVHLRLNASACACISSNSRVHRSCSMGMRILAVM